tara:strand:- start:4380 stop:4565 length:186 start_codon:yes stop_codon:yes gene_type:complete
MNSALDYKDILKMYRAKFKTDPVFDITRWRQDPMYKLTAMMEAIENDEPLIESNENPNVIY